MRKKWGKGGGGSNGDRWQGPAGKIGGVTCLIFG